MFELPHQGDHSSGPQRKLFDKNHRFHASALVVELGCGFGRVRNALADHHLEIATIFFDQSIDRRQVQWHPGTDLLLGQLLGQRDFDGAIKWHDPCRNLAEYLDRMTKRIVIAQDRSPELATSDLNLLGKRYLLLTAQQRYLTHLG